MKLQVSYGTYGKNKEVNTVAELEALVKQELDCKVVRALIEKATDHISTAASEFNHEKARNSHEREDGQRVDKCR